MRFNVTALGATAGQSVADVVRRIVDYLEPATQVPGTGTGPTPAVRYYADRGDQPGYWLGRGAAEAGLVGEVANADFARVLAGRDPRTGARLVTAQGSAGRRPTLGVGAETRRTPDGEPLYDARDAAALLGLRERDVNQLLDRGAAARATGNSDVAPPGDSYLIPVASDDRTRWVSERELTRFEQARLANPAADRVADAGEPGDVLPLADAAPLAGLTPQYLRSLCRYYEEHAEEIVDAEADGRTIRRAYLIGQRSVRGSWQVRRDDLVAFLRRRRAPAVRVGFDLTLTTEKSLGVLALLAEERTSRTMLAAIRAGRDVGLAYFEEHAALARVGSEHVGTRGLMIASFEHLTSRALDPFPHHHNIVANTVIDEHGTRRALDAYPLYRNASAAGAVATAQMRYEATRDLGVRWRRSRHGGWEIDGISEDVCRELSQRRGDIDDAVRELEEAIGRGSTLDELDQIVLATRPPKRTDIDAAELRAEWWERVVPLGLTPEVLAGVLGRTPAVPPPPPDEDLFARLAAPEGLCAAGSIFTRSDVLAALADLPVGDDEDVQPLLVPAAELERLADAFLASPLVVELFPTDESTAHVPARLRGTAVFTTVDMLAVQRRILDTYTDGRTHGVGVVAAGVRDAVLVEHPRLTAEQRDLVARFTASGQRVQCAVGRAGAGKTTTMRAVVDAWTAAGYRVLGAAVKGEAARILGEKAGIRSETLAWYLAACRAFVDPLDKRTVLIVDEASTVSDRDFDDLLRHVVRRGATVRLIGDPAQHGAVAAGGMFRVLCERHPDDTPELTESFRLKDPHDLAAATALREGRIDEAFDELRAAGHLHEVGSDLDLTVNLLRRWRAGRDNDVAHPVVDRRNSVRRPLNRLAHRLRQAAGEVGSDELAASGGRTFSVGDDVVVRETNRDLQVPGKRQAFVRNGATGTVVAIRRGATPENDVLTVDISGTGRVDLPREFFDEHQRPDGRYEVGIDHAYAVTSYAIQGAEFGESTSRIDENTSRNEAYVDLTRGRFANHLYVTRAPDPLDGEQLPRVPPPPIAEAVAGRLHNSRPERAAVDLDPDAEPPRELTGLDLHELHAAKVATIGPELLLLRRAELARERAVARQVERRADPDLLAGLPARPDVPYLLHRWQQALAAAVVYRERWRPSPGTGPWEWAVGPPGDDPARQSERDAALARLRALAVTSTAEALRAHGWPELPGWARAHAVWLASHGRCRPDPAVLADLYRRVAEYRNRAGLDGPDPPDGGSPMLGPEPDDPALAAVRAGLRRELGHIASQPIAAGLTPEP